jgi:hypothetical protein
MAAMRVFHRVACIGVAMVAGLPIARASERPHREPVLVGIALDVAGSEEVQDAAAMIAEADAIWRQYGVIVVDASREITRVDVVLKVIIRSSRSGLVASWRTGHIAHAGDGRLGEIVFNNSGRPADAFALDPDAIAATIRRTRADVCDVDACPPAFLKVVMARALGRVLAHEIGHYLLALPAHAASGLMRSAFTARELAGLDRQTFALSAALVPRLRDRLLRLRSERTLLVAPY